MHFANANAGSHVDAPRQLCRNSSGTSDVIDAMYVGGLRNPVTALSLGHAKTSKHMHTHTFGYLQL